MDLPGPCLHQDSSSLLQGCTGGDDIIDEQNPFSLHTRGKRKDASDIFTSASFAQFVLWFGVAPLPPGLDGEVPGFSQNSGDVSTLVVAALEVAKWA